MDQKRRISNLTYIQPMTKVVKGIKRDQGGSEGMVQREYRGVMWLSCCCFFVFFEKCIFFL